MIPSSVKKFSVEGRLEIQCHPSKILIRVKQEFPKTRWHTFSVHAYVFRALGGMLRATGAGVTMKLVPAREFYFVTDQKGILKTYLVGVSFPVVHNLTDAQIKDAVRFIKQYQKGYIDQCQSLNSPTQAR
jgi:hypothetical protein